MRGHSLLSESVMFCKIITISVARTIVRPMPPLQMTDRQDAVLKTVEARGFVTIEGLAAELGVSAQTVRRDIIALDAAGLLQRFHGGAGVRNGQSAVRLDHRHKQGVAADAKKKIARRAAMLVPKGATVFLDVGTTVEAAAAELCAIDGLTVFTNSLYAAMFFRPDRHRIYVLGGQLGGNDGSLVGASVTEALARLRPDYAFIGCSAIEPGGAVMDFDIGKIEIKKTAMRVSTVNCLLAVAAKFGRSALAQIATADEFDHVISDQD